MTMKYTCFFFVFVCFKGDVEWTEAITMNCCFWRFTRSLPRPLGVLFVCRLFLFVFPICFYFLFVCFNTIAC